jgi:hypothetical protein
MQCVWLGMPKERRWHADDLVDGNRIEGARVAMTDPSDSVSLCHWHMDEKNDPDFRHVLIYLVQGSIGWQQISFVFCTRKSGGGGLKRKDNCGPAVQPFLSTFEKIVADHPERVYSLVMLWRGQPRHLQMWSMEWIFGRLTVTSIHSPSSPRRSRRCCRLPNT